MKIRLLAFATAADALGAGEVELELPEGIDVGALRDLLLERYPDLSPVWDRLAVAVDGKVAGAERKIEAGAEVALLPPVSGGSGGSDDASDASDSGGSAGAGDSSRDRLADSQDGSAGQEGSARVDDSPASTPATRLTEEPIDLAELDRQTRSSADGALLLFVGRVRDHHRGRGVRSLTYSAYRPMAERALARIAHELEGGSPGLTVRIVHRLGRLAPSEASVAIAVTSPHREEAYRASRAALERLKREVPIWKRELYADGELVWREEEPLGTQVATASRPS